MYFHNAAISIVTRSLGLTRLYKGGSILHGYAKKVGKTLLFGLVILAVAAAVYIVGSVI